MRDAGSYDLVIGNAPWGKGTATDAARAWSEAYGWPIANKDIGSLFLAKGIILARPGGRIAMVQSAGTLLLNDGSLELRQRLFETAVVEEITNFSILRFKLFSSATSPACSVIVRKETPTGENTLYMCPKPLLTGEDEFRVIIDDTDVHFIAPLAAEAGLPEDYRELTTATRKERRIGRFEPDVVRRAIQANQPTSIVLNHVDYLDRALRDGAQSAHARDFLRVIEATLGTKIDRIGLGPNSLVPRSDLEEKTQPGSRQARKAS